MSRFSYRNKKDTTTIGAKTHPFSKMPLFKTIQPNPETTILVWKISESYDEFISQINLNSKSLNRLQNMKSELHQRGFLSIRKLLETAGYSDFDLSYDLSGKPHLDDNKFISISHSNQFSAIIISNQKVGIDIEKQREKIITIADKFALEQLNKEFTQNYIQKLTIIWGAKEAIFKIENQKGISFKDHILLQNFEIENQNAIAILNFEGNTKNFDVQFIEIEDFTLVWVFEGSSN